MMVRTERWAPTRATREILHAPVINDLGIINRTTLRLSRPKSPQTKGKRLTIRKFGSKRKLPVNERPRTAIVTCFSLTSDDDLSLEESGN